MTATRTKLTAFVVVSVLALSYGLTQLFEVQRLVRPAYAVDVVFADPEGLYPRAGVDLLGVPVGSVREVVPGPGDASTVVLELDPGTEVPADVRAVAASKSAIGEQYVQLEPQSNDGPLLEEGDTIPLSRTTSPPDLARLLGNTQALVDSVPPGALRTTLREGALALGTTSPELRRIIDDLDTLSGSAARNADDLTGLIDDAQVVLDTQVALREPTGRSLSQVAGLTTELRRLDPTFARAFVRGTATGRELSRLLRDNQAALPVLLTHLLTLTDLGSDNLPGIRKALTVFPWALEYNSQALRYCDTIDPRTGEPDPETCHYDSEGLPIWSAHIANVTSMRGGGSYQPCTRGYEGTPRYMPNGQPADGSGPRQGRDAPPNYRAGCTAPPTDPNTPNVRGFQNIEVPGRD